MQVDLGPEAEAFRGEISDWIAANRPAELAELVDWYAPLMAGSDRRTLAAAEAHPAYRTWEERLAEARLICPQWPEEVGGRGLGALEMAVFQEELYRAGVPRVTRGMGESLVGPSIIVHATAEQKAHFLPRIIDGTDRYCQGFSEPDHGSDLAGVDTRGVVDGDEVVITGQKVWTSGAMRANMMFVLCRTDPAAAKHRGLSYVLVPMADNHIEVRPIRQMGGASEFCEEFITGARAPLFNVIGGLGNGWRVAMTTLGNERGGRAAIAHLSYEREFWDLVEVARKHGRTRDPLIRQRLAWAYQQVELMRYAGLRLLATLANQREPGPEASISKLQWSEYHRRFGELAADIVGASMLAGEDVATGGGDGGDGGDGGNTAGGGGGALGRWHEVLLLSRAGTIYSGTSEIQRNVIAERALGLPKDVQLG
ncbi:MAG: acyl-CoA dehydrogenase family protein [Actinomycetota bacterium]|nr:acyl-CoA dehydrogenase family protein [Actinomycetota bacterium]